MNNTHTIAQKSTLSMQRYCKTSRIGVFLVYAYLWEVVIFKSRLTWLVPSAWAMHMVLSGIIPALIVLIGMNLPAPVVHPKIARIRALIMLTCSLIFFWSMISAMYQAEPLVEAAYAVMWFTMVLACWWASPRILNFVELKRVVFWQMLPIAAGVVISAILFFLKQNYDPMTDRYAGVFYTSPAMSEAARLALIFAIGALIIYKQAHSTHIVIAICAILCIILTRQRESLAQMMVLLTLPIVIVARPPIKVMSVFSIVFITIMLLVMYENADQSRKDSLMSFIRVNQYDSAKDLLLDRQKGYLYALERIHKNPMFGIGYTQRYSSEGANIENRTQGKMNVNIYSFDDDPHIAVLTLGLSIGYLGGVLGIVMFALIIALGFNALLFSNSVRVLLIMCVATAVMSSLFTNTLLSFGAINDRYLWATISILSAKIGHADS